MNRLVQIARLVRPFVPLALPALILTGPAAAHTDISAATAQQMIEADDGVVVVDVREYAEHCGPVLHIADAANLPWNTGVLQARLAELPTDVDIILVCASGNRSNQAANHLDAQGFTHVYDMLGGMGAWSWDKEACDPEPALVLSRIPSGVELNWTPTGGTQDYDLLRGTIADLSDAGTHVDLGPTVCLVDDSPFTWRVDADVPGPGNPWFYLARQKDGPAGESSAGQQRLPGNWACD